MIADERPFCLCADGLRARSDLWSDVAAVRATLRDGVSVCNLIEARYSFAVLLLAAMANDQTTILPPSRAEEAVAASLAGIDSALTATTLQIPANTPAPAPSTLPGEVRLFTSGSTGAPVGHRKDWRALVGGSRLASDLVGQAGLEPSRTLLIGTTPHQHMYGLEAALFTGIAHGHCILDLPVFFPADLDAAVELALRHGFGDIAVVTTPPHLRYLEAQIRKTPAIRCIISATAPLHADLARRLEDDGARKVFEIYGSTETGSLAWRRPTECDAWTPIDGAHLTVGDDGWHASVPHLASTETLKDEIELLVGGGFRLLGRTADMVRIAGKRQSLGALNAVLCTVDEIADAVVIRKTADGEDRLQIYVVPRSEGPTDVKVLTNLIRAHFLRHVDPIFVPKSIEVVPELPRNRTGKFAQGDLDDLSNPLARQDR